MFNFLILSLICWRLTYMLTEEDGPFDIIFEFRVWVNESPLPVLDCFYCTSVWVALPLAFFTDNPLLYWLALSAAAIFLHIVHERFS